MIVNRYAALKQRATTFRAECYSPESTVSSVEKLRQAYDLIGDLLKVLPEREMRKRLSSNA
jgi:hypothetical protein